MAEEPSKPNADLPVILQSPANLSLKPEGEVPSKKSFDEMMAGVADKIREQMKLSPNREPSKQENEESAEPAEVHEKLTIPIFAMVLSDDLFLLQVAIKNLFRMKKSKTLNFIFLRNVATLPSFVLTNLCTEDIEGVGPIHFRCPMMRYFTWEVKLSELFGGEVGPAKKGDILSFHFDENMKYQVKATFAGIESKYALPFTHPSEPVFFGLRFDRKELYLENFDAMQEILAPIACLESVISVLDYLHSTAKPEQCDICTFDIHKEVLIPCGHVLCRRCCHRIAAVCPYCNKRIQRAQRFTEMTKECVFPACQMSTCDLQKLAAVPCFCIVGCTVGALLYSRPDCPVCRGPIRGFFQIYI